MKYEFVSQSPGSNKQQTILHQLKEVFRVSKYDTLYAASAYATVEGVRQVLEAASKYTRIQEYRWVLGLDDYITHPKALELCRDLNGSILRVASFSRAKRCIFHSKVMLLSTSTQPEQSLMIIGSANLTRAALERNAEAVVLLRSETTEEAQQLLADWEQLWRLGKLLSPKQLTAYYAKFDKAKQARKLLANLDMNTTGDEEDAPQDERVSTSEAELDASQATVCWLELGSNVGGREIEIVAAQLPFFGLSSADTTPQRRSFIVSDASLQVLNLKYRGNAMWRLELTKQVPELTKGLRIGKERSPYVAVITKTKLNQFLLQFVLDNSAEYAELKAKSADVGTLDKTSARSYGWY